MAKVGRRQVRFGDVVRLSKTRCQDPLAEGYERFVGLEHLEPGDLRIRSWGNVGDGTTFTNVFQPGQVLFGKRRAYQRKVAVADFAGVCSGDIYVLESRDAETLLPDLLPFICQTDAFFEHAVGTSAGSLSPRTNWTSLASFEFALPPVEEQKRICSLLTTIADVTESSRVAVNSLPNVRRALERDLLTTNAFERRKVGEVAKFSSGKGIRVSDLPKVKSEENPIPVFGGNGISGYTNTGMPGTEYPTVVIGRVGQFCGVTSMTTGSCWITDNALFPVTLDENVRSAFLAICLHATNLNRRKLGEYLPLITQEVVHKVEIPVPSLGQQDMLIARFAEIASGIGSLEARQTKIRLLVKNVLNGLWV